MLPVARAWLEPFRSKKGLILADNTHPERRPTGVLRARGLGWRHNGLRDAFASYRAAVLSDVAQVSYEMGNSPVVVMRDYRKVVSAQAATHWWELTPERARVLAASVPKLRSEAG